MAGNSSVVGIAELSIRKVRHLENIRIPVMNDETELKHLIITGKNGSGKTSVLYAISKKLADICGERKYEEAKQAFEGNSRMLSSSSLQIESADKIEDTKQRVKYWKRQLESYDTGIDLKFNVDISDVNAAFRQAKVILAFFKDDRNFVVELPHHVEKVELKDIYSINDNPRTEFVKYLVDKKFSQSLYQTKNEQDKANELAEWFNSLENLLKDIFNDPSLTLDFDIDTYSFKIHEDGREVFDFNTMSAGYAAILDIVVSIIMRMEKHIGHSFSFMMPGIVIIDELETHLHYELQKKVLPFLCRVFPNIQFIVSTHSAFILNSISNAVIYDLENQTLVSNGLSEYPYEGIVEGYFDISTLSKELQAKFERFKELIKKEHLSKKDYAEIAQLEMYLEEIPDYLALDISTEYQRLKLELMHRESIHG